MNNIRQINTLILGAGAAGRRVRGARGGLLAVAVVLERGVERARGATATAVSSRARRLMRGRTVALGRSRTDRAFDAGEGRVVEWGDEESYPQGEDFSLRARRRRANDYTRTSRPNRDDDS